MSAYIAWLKGEIRSIEVKIMLLQVGLDHFAKTMDVVETQRIVHDQINRWRIELDQKREVLTREQMSLFPSSDYSRD